MYSVRIVDWLAHPMPREAGGQLTNNDSRYSVFDDLVLGPKTLKRCRNW